VVIDLLEERDDASRAADELLVATFFESIGQDLDLSAFGLSDSVWILLLLSLLLDDNQIMGLDTPEGLEVIVNLVILIRELNVVFLDVLPPVNE
jgi:hypothetical protein